MHAFHISFSQLQIIMTNKNILAIPLIAILSSCFSAHEKTVPVETLEGHPVALDSAYYGSKAFLLCGKLLFTWSKSSEETCYLGILTGDSLTNYQGGFRRGHGSNEFQDVALARGKDSSVFIAVLPSGHNQILSVIRTGKAKSIEALKDVDSWTRYDVPDLPPLRCVVDAFLSLSDSTILVPGAPYDDIEHLMTIINFKNQTLESLDYWPEDDSHVEGSAKHGVYTDNCEIFWNGNNLFLYVCGEGNYAFIFTVEGKCVKVMRELYSKHPQYEYYGDDQIGRLNYIIKNRPTRRLKADVNDQHIYVFLKEKDKDGNIAESWRKSVCGNTVEEYDWEGNLKKKIVLDQLGHNIKVTDDDRLLYLFSANPDTGEPEIWMYEL